MFVLKFVRKLSVSSLHFFHVRKYVDRKQLQVNFVM